MVSRKQFGLRVKERRRKLRMTQGELATTLKITSAAVSRWERGDGMPVQDNLTALADALKTTTHHLLHGTPTFGVKPSFTTESPDEDEAAPVADHDDEDPADEDEPTQEDEINAIIAAAEADIATRLRLPASTVRLKLKLDLPRPVMDA
ncbi:helix-turn-helix domain-containing protein [Methylorubrum extorquens]|uniref:helix-turn-helix domain-containing protein n=1 Tax=Methylorubrum extorquens TaxID=408 RepID=UPI0020A07229|nr:transcriptional regulator with XRE-family HTH domain [Methylorubrum extorquens]